MFDPRLIFIGLWLMQVLGHAVPSSEFSQLSWRTWEIVVVAMAAFLIGSQIGTRLAIPDRLLARGDVEHNPRIRLFSVVSLTLYLIGCVVAGIALYGFLIGPSDAAQYKTVVGGVITLEGIRAAVNTDFIGDRTAYNMLRVFYFGVGLCIFLLAFARNFTWKEIAVIVVIGLASAVVTTGRLYLLLFAVATSALLYRQRLISVRAVIGAGFGFIILFVVIAILFNKSGGPGSMIMQIVWNLKVYTLGGLGCFNHFVNTGIPEFSDGALLPNAARTILSCVGISVAAKPVLMPFSFVPAGCNTYTALFPLYHDGHMAGVLAGFFLFGVFHQYLYKLHLGSQSPIVWYVFALSIYPLVMSIFEDAYFSSPGFWLTLWLPPLMYLLWRWGWHRLDLRARRE